MMNDINYKYEEMIKTLIILAMPADKQIEYSGEAFPFGDDIINDFDVYYSCSKSEFLENNFLSETQIQLLDKLDGFVGSISGEEFTEFWTNNSLLKTHSDWEKIRSLAKDCLIALNKGDSGIKVEIENECDDSNNIIRKIQTKIIEK